MLSLKFESILNFAQGVGSDLVLSDMFGVTAAEAKAKSVLVVRSSDGKLYRYSGKMEYASIGKWLKKFKNPKSYPKQTGTSQGGGGAGGGPRARVPQLTKDGTAKMFKKKGYIMTFFVPGELKQLPHVDKAIQHIVNKYGNDKMLKFVWVDLAKDTANKPPTCEQGLLEVFELAPSSPHAAHIELVAFKPKSLKYSKVQVPLPAPGQTLRDVETWIESLLGGSIRLTKVPAIPDFHA